MDPAITVALVGAVVSLTAARWGLQHSKKVDAISARSGIADENRAGVEQLFKGSNDLIDQLQEENKRHLASATERQSRLDAMTMEVARLRRKYGNGNGDTPQPPNKE